MKSQFEMLIDGRVQHVGFRYYARARALELDLTGYVRNTPEGKVLVVAEGELSALETLADYLRAGPPMARVSNLTVSRSGFTGSFDNFTIRF